MAREAWPYISGCMAAATTSAVQQATDQMQQKADAAWCATFLRMAKLPAHAQKNGGHVQSATVKTFALTEAAVHPIITIVASDDEQPRMMRRAIRTLAAS